jgi:hypothetical protein
MTVTMAVNLMVDMTVIVPLAPGETAWTALAADLALLPPGCEILLVGPEAPALPAASAASGLASLSGRKYRLAWLRAGPGRARQMNAAARAATGRHLWFVHADTRFGAAALPALGRSLRATPRALHYFDLGFSGGPSLMAVNAAGVWLRSHLLRMPFGDQGFCLERSLFLELGGFDEDAPYGEDHLLVWQARRAGVPLRCTGTRLVTSARKYQERGWAATTLRHLYLTYKQAWPELKRSYGREGGG